MVRPGEVAVRDAYAQTLCAKRPSEGFFAIQSTDWLSGSLLLPASSQLSLVPAAPTRDLPLPVEQLLREAQGSEDTGFRALCCPLKLEHAQPEEGVWNEPRQSQRGRGALCPQPEAPIRRRYPKLKSTAGTFRLKGKGRRTPPPAKYCA